MKFAQRQDRERDAAIETALRKHRNVRAAAKFLGMPSSTLHDRAVALGIEMEQPGRRPAKGGRRGRR